MRRQSGVPGKGHSARGARRREQLDGAAGGRVGASSGGAPVGAVGGPAVFR